MTATIKIFVDGTPIQATPEQNLLETCLAAGTNLPYFCWHKSLGSVGACRQCAVKIFNGPDDHQGRIVMACMTAATPNLRVSIADAQAAAFRESVIEMILTNHPHDCAVCEVGGECHLQDMTALTGHTTRRSTAPKRTHLNQNLGPLIKHEMNRCIGCYRCVRFYKDYAGGEDFGVFGSARNIYFGRQAEGTLESDFSGNLVEVCPTGVFVDKPFSARYRRKWDLRATPSICPHCATGCNITLQERAGTYRRTLNRYNPTLNGFFLCDKGRFGPDFLSSPSRLRPMLPYAQAVAALAEALKSATLLAIGSPRASLESNFALRTIAGPENFFSSEPAHDHEFAAACAAIMPRTPLATLAQAEAADAIFILGDDPAIAAPRLALSLRQAALRPPAAQLTERQIPAWHDNAVRIAGESHKTPVIIATPTATKLDNLATHIIRQHPNDLVQLALAAGLDKTPTGPAAVIALALKSATAPVIIAGGSAALAYAAANLTLALNRAGTPARLILLAPHANSIGLANLTPKPLSAVATQGKTIIILESNPQISARNATTIALDHIATPTTSAATLTLPIASFAESDGTFINLEGRIQTFHKAIFGPTDPPPAWELLRDAAIEAGRLPPGTWPTRQALLENLAREIPTLAPCLTPAPTGPATPTLPHRASGRTAATAHLDIREPAPPRHPNPAFSTTMEGALREELAPLVWSPGWNSNQAINKAPEAAPQTFLFPTPPASAPYFPLPPLPWSFSPATGADDPAALSPALIARGAAP